MTKDVHSMDTHPETGLPIEAPDDPLTLAFDWQARFAEQIAAHLAAKERRRNERAAFKAARNAGLTQRHARKLARLKGNADLRTPDSRPVISGDRSNTTPRSPH